MTGPAGCHATAVAVGPTWEDLEGLADAERAGDVVAGVETGEVVGPAFAWGTEHPDSNAATLTTTAETATPQYRELCDSRITRAVSPGVLSRR